MLKIKACKNHYFIIHGENNEDQFTFRNRDDDEGFSRLKNKYNETNIIDLYSSVIAGKSILRELDLTYFGNNFSRDQIR